MPPFGPGEGEYDITSSRLLSLKYGNCATRSIFLMRKYNFQKVNTTGYSNFRDAYAFSIFLTGHLGSAQSRDLPIISILYCYSWESNIGIDVYCIQV